MLFIAIITSVLIFYFNEFSAALGNTNKLPIETSVWMPIVIIFIFSAVGLIHANQNKIIFTIFCFLIFFTYSFNLFADEFDISASEISLDKTTNILIGKGEVEVKDKEGKIIKADKVVYEKSKDF